MKETPEEWLQRMHDEVQTFIDPNKSIEENVDIHVKKLTKWAKENPCPEGSKQ